MRISFQKGKQREFLELVRQRIRAPSIRAMLLFGFSTTEDSLKNYYSERRLLPLNLFDEMLHLAKLNIDDIVFEKVGENWGNVKGGKKSKRK